MITSWKRSARWLSASLSAVFQLIFLAACGGVSAASPTPTQAPQVQTYTGDGSTIHYPQDWKVQTTQPGAIAFTDPQKLNTVTIVLVPNQGGVVSASNQLKLCLVVAEKLTNMTGAQPVG